jgi:hypothetical protein
MSAQDCDDEDWTFCEGASPDPRELGYMCVLASDAQVQFAHKSLPRIILTRFHPMPKWAQDWIYVTDSDKFFNLVSKQDVTPRGFRAMFNRQMPLDQAGNREWADQYALEQWGMPVAHHKGYMPSAGPVF